MSKFKFISNIFSSSQITILYITIIYTIINSNYYGIYLATTCISKIIISRSLKSIMHKLSISKRPSTAINCNIFNCGGRSTSGGFPSGHMMQISILSFVIYNIYKKTNNIIWIALYLLLLITTYISRLYCHTHVQLLGGYFIGLLLSVILYYIDIELTKKFETYKEHREVFYNHFK